MEAEYMAATQAMKEAIWLQCLLADMGHPQKGATVIHEDNHGCIGLAKNPIHHARTKHIDIQHHFVRERVESGEVELKPIPTSHQLADVLTKALTKDRFNALVDKLVKGLFWGGVLKDKNIPSQLHKVILITLLYIYIHYIYSL